MKINFETLDDGSVRLVIEGTPEEVGRIQSFVMMNMGNFMSGLTGASKERVDE